MCMFFFKSISKRFVFELRALRYHELCAKLAGDMAKLVSMSSLDCKSTEDDMMDLKIDGFQKDFPQ